MIYFHVKVYKHHPFCVYHLLLPPLVDRESKTTSPGGRLATDSGAHCAARSKTCLAFGVKHGKIMVKS